MFRSCQIITRELCCSLLKLCYNIHSLIRFCKQGVVAACHVVWECVVERAVGYMCVAHVANLGTTKLPDDDLARSKHVRVILSVSEVFYVKVT